jgi:hypothetical protein
MRMLWSFLFAPGRPVLPLTWKRAKNSSGGEEMMGWGVGVLYS